MDRKEIYGTAENEFCDQMDSYIDAIMDEEDCDYETAVGIAQGEEDEYWRVLQIEYGEIDG
jgi:hypothetical protein